MADRYASLKQGLVGCWIPSVSGSGLLLPDLSGRNNNGSLVNMDASDWVSSGSGRALDFDGVDDVVRLPFNIEMPFTVSGWFLSRSTTAIQYALSICSSTSNAPHYSLIFDGNAVGDLIYAAQEGDATTFQGSSFTGYVANQMYHLTGVFRSSTSRQLYVNANAQAVNTTSVGTTTINRLAIGRFDRLTPAVPFDGVADDIRIYNRALTEPEIKLLSSERGIGFKRSTSAFATRYTYNPPKPRNYSVIRTRDPNYSTLRQGLVAAYCPSISGQGNVLPDLVGGNHGTLTNMTADDWVSSGDGRALDFDGTDDNVVITNLQASTSRSIATWVRTTSSGSRQGIFGNGVSENGVYIDMLSTGVIRAAIETSGVDYIFRDSSVTINDGSIKHICVTYSAANVKIFVNGIDVTTGGGTSGTIGSMTSTAAKIGQGFGTPYGGFFAGSVDDTRIYTRTLTESEIKLLASKRGIGLRQESHRNTFYQFPSGARRRRILTGMP